MQEFIILLALLTLVRVWTIKLPEMIGFEPLPFKPFNCTECLSFWVGLVATLITFNLYTLHFIYSTRLMKETFNKILQRSVRLLLTPFAILGGALLGSFAMAIYCFYWDI